MAARASGDERSDEQRRRSAASRNASNEGTADTQTSKRVPRQSPSSRGATESGRGESRSRSDRAPESETTREPGQGDEAQTPRTLSAGKAARLAMQQVSELTNRQPESVTNLESTGTGWRVGVEVVESHRIPDSTDILAVYDTELDGDGELVSYRRSQRYYRGRAQED